MTEQEEKKAYDLLMTTEMTYNEIAREMNYSVDVLYKLAKKNGIHRTHGRKMKRQKAKRIIQQFYEGMMKKDIAISNDVSVKTVYRVTKGLER